MTNGQNVARSRHLEELARAAKRYTLREILDVTEAVAAELGGLSSADYSDFTGATSITSGLSGLVPAPQTGDESKFLRGDGTWASVESGSAGGTVLDTVPSTVDGELWYEVSNGAPALWLHKGNYDYRFDFDRLRLADDTNRWLVAYLPFTNNFADACGNEWTATGNPSIVDGALYLNGSCCLTNSTISDSIGELPWTIDFWVSATGESRLFGTFNAKYNRGQKNQWVSAFWENGHVTLHFYDHPEAGQITVTSGTRHHLAFTYDETTIRLFVDGVLSRAYEHEITLGGEFLIGTSPNTAGFLTGSIDHFRIHKGVALWTADFTLPTAADYA